MTTTAPLTGRQQLTDTATHWGWDVIGARTYANESYYRRAPFTILVEFSPTDSVVAASFWLDPPTGERGLKPRCLHSINGGNEQRHRIERWMTTHGESATNRRLSPVS